MDTKGNNPGKHGEGGTVYETGSEGEKMPERKKRVGVAVCTPGDVAEALKDYCCQRQEHFFCITLDTAHRLIHRWVVTIGTLDKTIVHPRDIFYRAIKDNAAAVILAHNHPSGS
jgi:DNA repair protein RadC